MCADRGDGLQSRLVGSPIAEPSNCDATPAIPSADHERIAQRNTPDSHRRSEMDLDFLRHHNNKAGVNYGMQPSTPKNLYVWCNGTLEGSRENPVFALLASVLVFFGGRDRKAGLFFLRWVGRKVPMLLCGVVICSWFHVNLSSGFEFSFLKCPIGLVWKRK